MRSWAYDDVGQGFPVVLIHGHPFNRSMWAPQREFLRPEYRVIAPDLRGYGENFSESEKTPLSVFAADILELLDSLAIDRCVLGGLSMGGQIVLECYRQFPERIAGLVLADTFAQLDTPERKQLRLDTAARLIAEGMNKYSQEELPRMIAPHHVQTMPGVAEHVLRMMETSSPVDQDQYTPVSDARFMQERIPGAELAIIKDAGHMPNLERSGAFNVKLAEFLARVFGNTAHMMKAQ